MSAASTRSDTGRDSPRPATGRDSPRPATGRDSPRSDIGRGTRGGTAPIVEIGAPARQERAARLDRWVASLLPEWPSAVALLAVGGLGRRESAPHSDLDLVLLHDGCPNIGGVADSIWYPIWDARLGLDHSVRTVPDALAIAGDDVKVALALLDARILAGDVRLADALRSGAVDLWRRTAARVLPQLRELTEARWATHGELAFLLEGDLKGARGGLRDIAVLRGIGLSGVADVARPAVRAAHVRLLDVRDALHAVTGRRVDRLVAQEREAVADLLQVRDGDALLRRIGQDARAIAYAMDDAWRAVDRWLTVDRRHRGSGTRPAGGSAGGSAAGLAGGGSSRRPLGRDVVEQQGEVVLARAAVGPRPDPALALRVAAAAAAVRLPIARPTLEWLARFCGPLPAPWPAPVREALLTLLGTGTGLLPIWEACDRYGLISTWLPEWSRVRSLPQHNPVHRYTVDRHLVQAAAEAARFAREVARPDLLVLGALLHDIGKGLPGDHSEAGAPLAGSVARRIGLPDEDVATIERLVRIHLLLPETATRRDVTDPVTVTAVADAVGDVSTLELLHAIARADAAATGPAAWSSWKGRLVADLVDRVRRTLDTGVPPAPPPPDPTLVAGALPAVHVTGEMVSVAANDRRGLLAAVAGCLALHRLEVITADVSTVDGRALVQCAVEPRYGQLPDPDALAADLRRAALGQLPRLARLAARPSATRSERAVPSARASTEGGPRAVWHRDAARGAGILEVRAADAPGLLYRVARALEEAGADVRAARISTLGGSVVDAFYLVGSWAEPELRAGVESAVLAAAG